ncbi:MAG: (Fe-S)-binding protein [Chloroflexi bacterium]|nr:(Fe-S)-binding protein [Chloroflexota bacterium]
MKTDATMPPTAPQMSDFSCPDFYRAMVEREHLQVAQDEVAWTERHGEPGKSVDVLLNFGCNARQTPHLMREAVAVFEVLGIDFAAVAGQQFCCGKPYSNNGFKDAARHVVEASAKRMASYHPSVEIQWCSACEMQFKDIVIPEIGVPFESMGLAAYLVDKIDQLGSRMPWKEATPVKALVHGHLGEHAVRDAHPSIAMALLQRIPGVEVVDTANIADTAAIRLCDNAGPKIATIGTEEYKAAVADLESYLARTGADTIAILYHGCTRELGKFANDKVRIRHYLSILAEALGVGMPDRFSEYWRLGDPVKVKEASRRNSESWGTTEDEALALAHKYFVPSYAVDQPDCPCNGECTRTGAQWLSAKRIDRDRLNELTVRG